MPAKSFAASWRSTSSARSQTGARLGHGGGCPAIAVCTMRTGKNVVLMHSPSVRSGCPERLQLALWAHALSSPQHITPMQALHVVLPP